MAVISFKRPPSAASPQGLPGSSFGAQGLAAAGGGGDKAASAAGGKVVAAGELGGGLHDAYFDDHGLLDQLPDPVKKVGVLCGAGFSG